MQPANSRKKISQIEKRSVFHVPAGYFENLPERIAARIEHDLRIGKDRWHGSRKGA